MLLSLKGQLSIGFRRFELGLSVSFDSLEQARLEV